MTTHVALLRGINVGTAKRIGMGDLRALLTDLGYEDPRTVLVSGNLVFGATGREASIEKAIHDRIAAELGIESDVLVRTAAQLGAVVDANPFVRRGDAVDHLHVTFLAAKPTAAKVKAVDPDHVGPDEFAAGDRVVYSVQPNGVMGTRLPAWEKVLGVRATARTWKTVLKIQALAAG